MLFYRIVKLIVGFRHCYSKKNSLAPVCIKIATAGSFEHDSAYESCFFSPDSIVINSCTVMTISHNA